MSLAQQCSDCCECPSAELKYTVGVEATWISTAAIPNFCGFSPYINDGTDCTVYRTKTISGTFEEPATGSCEYARRYVFSGAVQYGEGSCDIDTYAVFNAYRQDDPDCEENHYVVDAESDGICGASVGCDVPPCAAGKQTTVSYTATVKTITGCDFTGSGTETLSDPDTIEDAIARADSPSYGTSKCAYTGVQTGCSIAYSQTTTGTFNVTGDPDTTYTVRICYRTSPISDIDDWTETCEDVEVTTDGDGVAEFEWVMPSPPSENQNCFKSARVISYPYEISFPASQYATRCLRAKWIERAPISSSGVGITSLEIVSAGVYRPEVTITVEAGESGSGAAAVAVMSSTGTVSSIRILNPGSDYSIAPTITISTAKNGGTTATATATIEDGQIVSIDIDDAGDYLPTISFHGGGGSSATATCTMSPEGGIATITLDASGSGYTNEPGISISSKSPSYTSAYIIVHLGTETAKCGIWDKVIPEDYDPADDNTWPYLGPYEITDAEVVHIRTVCDCSSC